MTAITLPIDTGWAQVLLCWAMKTFGVKDERLDFGFGSLCGNFLALPGERDSGRIPHPDHNLAIGTNRCMSRRDEGFLCYELSVGADRNPRILAGPDDQIQAAGVFLGRGGRRFFFTTGLD